MRTRHLSLSILAGGLALWAACRAPQPEAPRVLPPEVGPAGAADAPSSAADSAPSPADAGPDAPVSPRPDPMHNLRLTAPLEELAARVSTVARGCATRYGFRVFESGSEVGETYVTLLDYPSVAEARAHLDELAEQLGRSAHRLTLGGSPALEQTDRMPVAGIRGPASSGSADRYSYVLTTAWVVGNRLVRVESRLPDGAKPQTRTLFAGAARRVAVESGGWLSAPLPSGFGQVCPPLER